MMKHREIENLILKKLDREITKDEEIHLFEHLEQCPDCNAYYLQMEQIKNEIVGLTEFFPRTDFNTRIFARIGIKQENLWQRLIPAFISVYLISLIVLLISPLPNYAFQNILLAIPGILQVLLKIESVAKGLALLTSSFIRLNLTQLLSGFLLSLLVFYVFIKLIKNFREEKWVVQKSY